MRGSCRLRPSLWGLSVLEASGLLPSHRDSVSSSTNGGDGRTEMPSTQSVFSCVSFLPVSCWALAPVVAKRLWEFPDQESQSSLCCWSDCKPRSSRTPTKQLRPSPPSQDSIWVRGGPRSPGDGTRSWCPPHAQTPSQPLCSVWTGRRARSYSWLVGEVGRAVTL